MALKEMRKKAGLTQRELATLVNISFKTVEKYESSAGSVDSARLETLCRLAITLKCSIADIIESEQLKILFKQANKNSN